MNFQTITNTLDGGVFSSMKMQLKIHWGIGGMKKKLIVDYLGKRLNRNPIFHSLTPKSLKSKAIIYVRKLSLNVASPKRFNSIFIRKMTPNISKLSSVVE